MFLATPHSGRLLSFPNQLVPLLTNGRAKILTEQQKQATSAGKSFDISLVHTRACVRACVQRPHSSSTHDSVLSGRNEELLFDRPTPEKLGSLSCHVHCHVFWSHVFRSYMQATCLHNKRQTSTTRAFVCPAGQQRRAPTSGDKRPEPEAAKWDRKSMTGSDPKDDGVSSTWFYDPSKRRNRA